MLEIENIASSSTAEESTPERISLFSETECEEIRNRVHELRHLWIRRHPYVPFYTLGTASYLDGFLLPNYLSLAQMFNNTLREELGWMYTKLFEALENHLQGPIVYSEKFCGTGIPCAIESSCF